MILSGKLPEGFGASVVKGSSLTIPGQGSDLAQIIASVVKLPPIDERTFDVGNGEQVDLASLELKLELDALYFAEGQNAGEDALKRLKARKDSQEAKPAENDEQSEEADKD